MTYNIKMKKINIQEEEIKNILNLHKQEKESKGLFMEQVTDLKSQLQKFIDTGCINGGVVVELKSANPNKKFAIKKESKKNPGTYNYFFIDFTFGNFDQTGKFVMGNGKWNCDHLQKAQLEKTKIDAEATTKALKDKQDEYIAALIDSNPAYIQNPTEGQKMSLKAVNINAPKDIFPNGLTLWYDPSGQSELKKSSSSIGSKMQQQEINRDVCRTYVDEFYTSFKRKNSIVIDPASFEAQKNRAQACKDAYYNEWGILGGGKKLDQYLDILSGKIAGGPTSYGEDSKWRLK